jgi:penicillin V acylase-like amidase (Ntn superfamily)
MRLKLGALLAASVMAFVPTQDIAACTRVVYLGLDGVVVTARSLDWINDMKPDLWVFPRGLQRDGAAGPKSVQWTSKYGSVVTTAYNAASTDGLNERGLVANLLWLSEAQYVTPGPDDKRRPLAISAWVQYVLDNYGSVAEAVEDMRKEAYYAAAILLDGKPVQVHLSMSDASGDSAVVEYLGGKLTIHHGRQYQVMTNSPPYDQQLSLYAYWQTVGGNSMLPGTVRAADRFVRMSYYVNTVKRTADPHEAVSTGLSLIRNASAPVGATPPPYEPYEAETYWRTVTDHKNRRYYFDSPRSLEVFWVELADLDLAPGAPARKLKLGDGASYTGNAVTRFEKVEPFKFLPAPVK